MTGEKIEMVDAEISRLVLGVEISKSDVCIAAHDLLYACDDVTSTAVYSAPVAFWQKLEAAIGRYAMALDRRWKISDNNQKKGS